MKHILHVVACVSIGSALAACDPIGYGYVNQLHQPVTVVHHVGSSERRFTLAAGEHRPPQLGDWRGERDDFLDSHGHVLASFAPNQMRGTGTTSRQYSSYRRREFHLQTTRGGDHQMRTHMSSSDRSNPYGILGIPHCENTRLARSGHCSGATRVPKTGSRSATTFPNCTLKIVKTSFAR